jgi:hypothetical protein
VNSVPSVVLSKELDIKIPCTRVQLYMLFRVNLKHVFIPYQKKKHIEFKGKISLFMCLIKCHVKKTYMVALIYTEVKWSTLCSTKGVQIPLSGPLVFTVTVLNFWEHERTNFPLARRETTTA